MKTKEITIRVDEDAANAYRSAPEEDRRKLDLFLSLRLSETTRSAGSLKDVMREISRKAQDRGLAADVLESILDEQ